VDRKKELMQYFRKAQPVNRTVKIISFPKKSSFCFARVSCPGAGSSPGIP
jgi:hypothetical protein